MKAAALRIASEPSRALAGTLSSSINARCRTTVLLPCGSQHPSFGTLPDDLLSERTCGRYLRAGSSATPKMPRWWPRNVLMRCSRRATWRGGRCEGEKPMTRRCIKETVERRTATQDPRLAPHRDLRGSICGVRRLRARNAERNLGLCGGLPMPSGRQLVTVRRSHVVWAPST